MFLINLILMSEIEFLIRMLLAVILGGIIGYEREINHKPAGLRTHMLVCLGSCIFMIVSMKFDVDPARVAAGVVSGIGFIGAGTIIAEKQKEKEIVHGVTTAAGLWATAGIGLLVGIGEYFLAVTAALIVACILWLRITKKRFSFREVVNKV